MGGIAGRLRELYDGDTERAYGLLAFDLATILFVVVSSFWLLSTPVVAVDVMLGLVVLADFLARLAISERRWREFLRPSTWADVVAIVAFLAPVFGHGAGFLRILRTLRLLRTYNVVQRLRATAPFSAGMRR